ncbi:MAG: sigma-70 family RNA polymerase sigma factor [Verrucomicrobiota bacterium]|nr:sigma-70 family RNA polymerase sigma factor [Verrucomicrobiota bacterium]
MSSSNGTTGNHSTSVPGQISAKAAFVTTHWSVVLAASRQTDTAHSRSALEELCRTYWYPLYNYVRRRGYAPEDACDLTQEFFARLLERHWLARADRSRGRFRAFLLTAMERFLANEWDKERALKRGGNRQFVPVQLDAAETRYGAEPTDTHTPEQAFERSWAMTLLETVLNRLEAEQRAEGKAEQFGALRQCLLGDREALPYAEIARVMGTSEGAVKVAAHRLRQRYRELLRAEIANTVSSAAEIDAEMCHLLKALTGG